MRLIDADALNGYKFGLISPYAQNLFHKIINEAPTIVQEQRIGHWYKKPHEICYTCDQCRTTNASGTKYNFCPHCGACMIEDVENTVQIHGLTFKKEHKTVGEHLKGGENE